MTEPVNQPVPNNKEPLQYVTLLYKGKLFMRQGINPKDNSEWKIWKLAFQKGQYDWNVSAFERLSLKGIQLSDMKEGQYYQVGYSVREYIHPVYGPKKSRTAKIIHLSTPDKSTEFDVPNNQQSEPKSNKLIAKNWVNFQNEYNELMKNKPEKSSVHMLGIYIVNHYSEECNDLIQLCKSNFK